MKQYKIFQHPDGSTEAVKQGWSWPAFFFSCFWAIAKKMWLTGTALFLASLTLGAVVGQAEMGAQGDSIINIISIAISIIFGLKGNDWWEAALWSQGYEEKTIVAATTPQGALAIYHQSQP
ncbi:DUF2628 domain-containing protein [Desulfogranum mediterraneum]|uniref:DUF2628 domain-containing protein n=1 Tax=Desulfogranum mediterraneum TaxID=160661 RepID=UPI00041432CD|nr:DUF2628 domain-containing protein [Desulfogranum mediterraneum]